jgi:hypothetical protein
MLIFLKGKLKMVQIDNLSVQGMANGTISFFSNVLQGLQAQYGTNANGWLNVVNDLDDIIYADHLRSVGLDSTDTSLYQAYSLVNNRKQFVDAANVDYISAVGNIDISAGVITPHYKVLIAEKQFGGNVTANAIALQTFISTTLDYNNTYVNANVTTSKQYSIDTGFVNDYTTLNSNSFDTAGIVIQIQDNTEKEIARIKTFYANNGYID